MAALTTKQQDQISKKLKDNASIVIVSEWRPDLACTLGSVTMVFHVADRSITVGKKHIGGEDFKGAGFVSRMVHIALESAQMPPEPVAKASPPIKRPPTPKPPTSRSPIVITRKRPPRKPPRVERDGIVFTTKT